MKNIIETPLFVASVKKSKTSNKFRDHCHLTSKYRGPAYQKVTKM